MHQTAPPEPDAQRHSSRTGPSGRVVLLVALVGVIVAVGWRGESAGADAGATQELPIVVTTTTMLGDLASTLAGEDADVRCILRPGGDPHLYQPAPLDARLIASSRLVIVSGLHLEGWIDELVDNAGGERARVVASEGIAPLGMAGTRDGVDPHFWFDAALWLHAARNVERGLVELRSDDPEAQARIRARAEAYRSRVEAVDAWVRAGIETIAEEHRVMVTSHDAFQYFGRAYGVQVAGIQGLSTEQAAGQRDVARIIDLIRERGAPAVFVETSVNPALIRQVARETGVQVAGPLHSDSVGPIGSGAESWIGMMLANASVLVAALDGELPPMPEEATVAELRR